MNAEQEYPVRLPISFFLPGELALILRPIPNPAPADSLDLNTILGDAGVSISGMDKDETIRRSMAVRQMRRVYLDGRRSSMDPAPQDLEAKHAATIAVRNAVLAIYHYLQNDGELPPIVYDQMLVAAASPNWLAMAHG